MKRLAVFCDGTWNRLATVWRTNAALAAEAVQSVAPDGVVQLVHYGEGIGTGHVLSSLQVWAAGAFGIGLDDKILDAYRFLIFNYEPGDEVFIFGFSRGAYTARALGGLVRKCGILTKGRVDKIEEALKFYRNRSDSTHPDHDLAQEFRLTFSQEVLMKAEDTRFRDAIGVPAPPAGQPPLRIRFIGVWDTVGAFGIPNYLITSLILRFAKRYEFYDTRLSSIVEAARHAVAVDETRRAFVPSLWENLATLNEASRAPDRYLQLWFPGDHGSVGGGGDITGLSAAALAWMLEGASAQGLAFDPGVRERIVAGQDALAALRNSSKPPGFMEAIYSRGARKGPDRVADVAESTVLRFQYEAKQAGWKPYRPKTLAKVEAELLIRRDDPA
ncbi:MAG: DUF2235 domain-containing protein [Cucumibacter sp.]